MTIDDHLLRFSGRDVIDFEKYNKIRDPKGEAIRISLSYDEYNDDGLYWEDKLDLVVADPLSAKLEAIVIGPWEDVGSQDSEFIVELLAANKDKLESLEAIFFGDIVMEESECSWIEQCDMSPLFEAFPKLTHFAVRGSNGLSFGDGFKHNRLRSLVVQCGGLPGSVVMEIINARLPELEHLELWLGEDNYGADFSANDLRGYLAKMNFPKLIYLGLKNSEMQDEVAAIVAESDFLKKIKVLDLSMGTLTDQGAEALLAAGSLIKNLEFLDLHHHYLTPGMVNKLSALGIPVNLDERQTEDISDGEVWRFIAVSE